MQSRAVFSWALKLSKTQKNVNYNLQICEKTPFWGVFSFGMAGKTVRVYTSSGFCYAKSTFSRWRRLNKAPSERELAYENLFEYD